ncbi:MAG: hypothetical protein ACPGR7_06690 [Flavobacteriaceae bacterium]
MKRFIPCLIFVLMFPSLQAQEKEASQEANANNPLANLIAFNVQFNYLSNNTATDATTMVTSFRYAQPIGKFLVRATVPVMTSTSVESNSSMSGLGDVNIFATYLASNSSSPVQFGLGPMVYAPTSAVSQTGTGFENRNFGANNWQVGAAAILFVAKSKQFQYGGLLTYAAGVGNDSQTNMNATESLAAIQPFYFFQLGKGKYLRGAPIWTFDFDKQAYNMPVGIGIGQVFKVGSNVLNLFIEPQYSIYSQGVNQPIFQIFSSINMQFY